MPSYGQGIRLGSETYTTITCLCGASADYFAEAAVGRAEICLGCLRALYWSKTDEGFSALLEEQLAQASDDGEDG